MVKHHLRDERKILLSCLVNVFWPKSNMNMWTFELVVNLEIRSIRWHMSSAWQTSDTNSMQCGKPESRLPVNRTHLGETNKFRKRRNSVWTSTKTLTSLILILHHVKKSETLLCVTDQAWHLQCYTKHSTFLIQQSCPMVCLHATLYSITFPNHFILEHCLPVVTLSIPITGKEIRRENMLCPFLQAFHIWVTLLKYAWT